MKKGNSLSEAKQFFELLKLELKENVKTRRVVLVSIIYVLVYAIVALLAIELDIIMTDFFSLMMQNEPELGTQISSAGNLWNIPFAVIIPYYVLAFMLPAVLAILSYRSISGEFDERTMPDLIMSASRKTIILAKSAGIFIISGLITLVLLLLNAIYSYMKLEQNFLFPTILMFSYFMFYSFALISVFMLISSLSGSSQQSLFLCFIGILSLVVLRLAGPLRSLSVFHYLGHVGPTGFLAYPLRASPILSGIVGFIIYGAVMLGGCILVLQRREI
jgi:ABC-type transport system involved in multi-copper enzyme maturation permease subunit